jgi:hypothetical protein
MRRALVSAAAVGAALAVLTRQTRTVSSSGGTPESMEVARARTLLRSLGLHDTDAAALGRRVIAGAAVESTGATIIPAGTRAQGPRVALGKLANDIAAAAGLSGQDIDADDRLLLARRLRRTIRADFRRGDTVRVDGWLLAATESRLFAMAALLSRRP